MAQLWEAMSSADTFLMNSWYPVSSFLPKDMYAELIRLALAPVL